MWMEMLNKEQSFFVDCVENDRFTNAACLRLFVFDGWCVCAQIAILIVHALFIALKCSLPGTPSILPKLYSLCGRMQFAFIWIRNNTAANIEIQFERNRYCPDATVDRGHVVCIVWNTKSSFVIYRYGRTNRNFCSGRCAVMQIRLLRIPSMHSLCTVCGIHRQSTLN